MKFANPLYLRYGVIVNHLYARPVLPLLITRIITGYLILYCPSLSAQFNVLDFDRLSMAQGMQTTPISGIVQDQRGYIWLGTPTGLFRYNGVSSKAYLSEGSLQSLPDNQVQQIQLIDIKVICLTPSGAFVHHCNTEKDTSLFRSAKPSAPAILLNNMTHACSDGANGLLLLSRSGFMHVDSFFHKIYEYTHLDTSQSHSISGSFGRVIFQMPDGNFIITGSNGMFLYDPAAKSTLPLQKGIYPALDPYILDQSLNVFELSPFEYLLFSRHQLRLQYYKANQNISFGLSVAQEIMDLLRWNTELHEVNDSIYYLLMPGKGSMTLKLDKVNHKMTLEPPDAGSLLPITMLVDRDHRIWLGTHNGLYKQRHLFNGIQKSVAVFDAALPEKSHVQFAISGPYLVTGTAEGMKLKFYDKKTLSLSKVIDLAPTDPTYTSSILHFATYSKDSIMVCTNGPRFWINTEDWTFHPIDPWVKIPTRYAWYAFQSKIDGALYTLQNGSTLERYDPSLKKFKRIPLDTELLKELRTPTQMSEDWNGDLWLSHQGFCRYRQATGKIDYCSNDFPGIWPDRNFVGSIVMDVVHKVMWFTLQRNGIIRYDPAKDTYIKFTKKQGLPDLVVNQMILVGAHLWIITPTGLASISTEDFTIRRYPYGSGVYLHHTRKALTYDAETDHLYFMDRQEIMACRPGALLNKAGYAQLLIEQMECGDSLWHWPDQAKMDIHGKDRNLRIQLSCVSFEDASPLQFSYRFISGRDSTWRNIGNDGITLFENLAPGKHAIQFRLSGTGNDIAPVMKTILIYVHPAFWETNWFKGLLAALCLLLMWRLARWQYQRKKSKLDIDRRLTELELNALRSRMNPHFIFNSLNSINRYILKEDKGRASYYLSQFAKLIRHILDYSTEANVSLSDELGVTKLYIELESLRMNNPIQLEIILDPAIDADNVRVPPLFIQPYVENAIWHGLAPKKEDLHLWVRVIKKSNAYIFEIEDNGVGRTTAARNQRVGQHVSKGLILARETFERYGQVYNMSTDVEIVDLFEPDGTPRGTCVVLTLESRMKN